MKLRNRDGSFSEVTALLNPSDDTFDVAVRVEGSDEFVSVPKCRLYVNGEKLATWELPRVEIVNGPRESRGLLVMSNLPYGAGTATAYCPENDENFMDEDDLDDFDFLERFSDYPEEARPFDYLEDDHAFVERAHDTSYDDVVTYNDLFGHEFDDMRVSR
jgi:hypothetical protein